jgi:AGZA family xanthine/uracil permease-like MFS transporter
MLIDLNAAQAVGGACRRQGRCGQDSRDRRLLQQGVLYHGLEVMGGGSILTARARRHRRS